MKRISGTKKFKLDSFPKQLKIKETEITKPNEIADELTVIGPNLAGSTANTTKVLKTT